MNPIKYGFGEWLAIKLAWLLPRRVAYWAFIRVSTYRETENPGDTTALVAAKRWNAA
jgi:hypothetical protein